MILERLLVAFIICTASFCAGVSVEYQECKNREHKHYIKNDEAALALLRSNRDLRMDLRMVHELDVTQCARGTLK